MLEVHNKDNYRGIAMLPVFCIVFEMILLRSLEQIAEENGTSHTCSFGFSEGVGCYEASFVIGKSINQLLEKRETFLHVFLMFPRHLTLSGYLVCYIS